MQNNVLYHEKTLDNFVPLWDQGRDWKDPQNREKG